MGSVDEVCLKVKGLYYLWTRYAVKDGYKHTFDSIVLWSKTYTRVKEL